MQSIDTNLYSRQIGAYGMEAMSKLVELKVFIYGLRGVIKSLTLARCRDRKEPHPSWS